MRKIIFILCILLCTTAAIAYSTQDVLWDGYTNVGLDKETFSDDENITGWIVISNSEYVPAFGQTTILQLNQGQFNYPSQFSEDNILDELVFTDTWILPRTKKRINFSFKPHNAGSYHLDTYVWTMKSMLNGSDSILMNPLTINFTVTGNTKNKNVYIHREKTVFEGQNGPVGFPVEPGQEFNGNVIIRNKEPQDLENLTLKLTICDWSCALEKEESVKKISIPKLTADLETSIDVSLTAPSIPSAYEIKMELFDNNVLLSHYKNRVVVTGGTAKIRKVYLNNVNENLILVPILSGSPDHFNYPDFKDFILELQVFNEDKIIEQKENSHSSIKSGEILDSNFNIESENFSAICLIIKKDDTIFEEECISIPISKAREEYDSLFPSIVDVKWDYSEKDKLLTINLNKDIDIDSVLRIVKSGTIIYDARIQNTKTVKEVLVMDRGEYVLTVDDLTAKRQIVRTLNLGNYIEEITASEVNDEETICTGQVCTNNTVCDTTPYASKDGACCLSKCIVAVQPSGFDLTRIPFILWIAILLLIIGIIILINTVKKMRDAK